jgi:uncharacterized repeat protein (TIGR01451 family)
MTRQALAAALFAVLAVGTAAARGTGPVADLSITKSDGQPTYTAGFSVTYTIVVGNAGPDAVVAATVSDPVTTLPQVASATWTCVGARGAACSASTTTGNIAATVDLPVGGTVTFTMVVTLSASASGDLINTATITPPEGTTDPVPDPSPNSATDTDTAATLFYVATTGEDSATCGPSASPCKTVQAAIDKTSTGDTVIVGTGTYNECVVVVPGDGLGGVLVIADQFLSSATTGSTILDGTDVCDAESDSPGPVVKVFDKSALLGLSVQNGGDSGVWGLGAVTISNNVISDNTTPTTGGGIRLSTGPYLSDPEASARIVANTIQDNTSGSDGAGIYVEASADGISSRVVILDNAVTTNTAGGTNAAHGGGIAVYTDTAGAGDVSSVVITTNTLDGNVANGAAAGAAVAYGGGIFVATGGSSGLGTETVTIGASGFGNVVRNNVTAGFGGGISAKARPAPGASHTIHVDANTVSANTGGLGGGGIHLFAFAFDRAAGAPEVVVSSSGNSINGNHARGSLSDPLAAGGGGIYAELYSQRTVASNVSFEISGNTIESNDTSTHGGGASLLASADDDPQSNGTVATTGAVVSFHNNLVATNAARDVTADVPSGGGVFGLAIARGASAEAGVATSFLTVANNETELGTGGVEWRDVLLQNSLGSRGTASFALTNSIVSDNDGYGVGYAVPLDPATAVTFSYNDAFGNISGNYQALLGNPTGSNGNISVDPELDALFLPRICGPMVDRGDPAIPATEEPMPNGGLVNLGHLGNTSSATRTFPDVNSDGTVDGLDVMGIAVSFNTATGNPRFFTAADRDLNGLIDGQDLAYVSAFYAQSCP